MKVIAISGVSGCGKTSVIKHLSERLSCQSLLFDDYTDENTYPSDMKHWLKSGADVSVIKTPLFVDALKRLKATYNRPSVCNENPNIERCNSEIYSSDFILIEEPFGRCRSSIAPLVDYVILLDVPMEVCLSRVIMRNINHPKADSLDAIPKYLSMYDDHLRGVYIAATDQVRAKCDLVIQDVDSIEATGNVISLRLHSTEPLDEA